jgi:hypothetical protein
MTTPTEGVNEPASINDAAELFLSRWADAEEPSDTDKGVTPDPEEDDATVQDEGDDTSDEDLDLEEDDSDTDQSDENSDAEGEEATDDHKVKLTVDGEEKTVTVKELKRLYGQEASLTRKSQEVAEARKAAAADAERYMLASQKLIEKAQARFQPFEKIDWMVAQQKLTPDEFAALRSEALEAHQDLQFLQNETGELLTNLAKEREAQYLEKAKEAVKVLERDIPNWSKETYEQVCTYATENGFKEAADVVDPAVIKFIHKAMRFDALKAKAAQKKTQAKTAPKRVVKPANSNSTKLGQNEKPNDALKKLAQTGSRDDAAAAFLERWTDSSDG